MHHPLVTDTRSLLWIDESELHHAARVDVARAESRQAGHLRLRSRSGRRRSGRAALGARSALRDLLVELGLPSWVKTSGSKGFHIVVPLDGKAGFGDVARFAGAVGSLLVKRDPRSPDAGVQQGGSRRPDLRRYGSQRLQRHVRGGLCRARQSRARRCRRRARGRKSSAATSRRVRSRCGHGRDGVAAVGDVWVDLPKRKRSLARRCEAAPSE